MTKEQLNHKAYEDVCELKNPTRPDDKIYMEYYRFWYNVAGGEKHFNSHYCELDHLLLDNQ